MVKNLALLLTALFLMLVLGEWLFPKILGKLPLRLYGSIDKNIRILAQSSKKGTFPHEYIAIVGDSYAVGAGDWLEGVRGTSFLGSPSYSPAHLINEKTGIDVVSFGQGGVGSFNGIWKEPISQFLYINSIKDYQLPSPKVFLVFFYEGNDIYNNVQFLRKKFLSIQKRSLKKNKLNEAEAFLNREFQNVLNDEYDRSLWKNALFTRSLFQGISNLIKEFVPLNKNAPFLFSFPKTPINLALINGKQAPLPMHLQAPPLFGFKESDRILGQKRQLTDEGLEEFYISKEEYKLGLFVFEQTLAMLVEFFPQTDVKVIFIPSPLSSYQMTSQKVSYRGYMEFENFEDIAVIERRHAKLCETIRSISVASKVSFLNSAKSLRKVASQEFIHGPADWDHFNKAGYEALSADISQVFLQSDGGTRIDNCVY